MPRTTQATEKEKSKVGPPGDLDNDAMEVDPQEQESDMECADAAASAEKKTKDAAAAVEQNTQDADEAVEKKTKEKDKKVAAKATKPHSSQPSQLRT